MAFENIDKTILYTTDSVLDPELAEFCRRLLLKMAGDMPIISVSQKPLDFGTNICVGDIGRSGCSLDKQLYAGSAAVKTKWVMLAEHDCVYSREHLMWIPPEDKYFYYNDNNWLLQVRGKNHPEYNGMYSYRRGRKVQSQMVAGAENYFKAMTLKLRITSDLRWASTHPTGRIAEPGCCTKQRTIKIARHPNTVHLMPLIMEYMDNFEMRDFWTGEPNLDLRHDQNYTGHRRGNKRRVSLPPWGTIEELFSLC